mgnify:CR=1 FL=1
MDDFIPIKNIMNELYAKDISRKVRSAHNTRGRAGEPLAHPPIRICERPAGQEALDHRPGGRIGRQGDYQAVFGRQRRGHHCKDHAGGAAPDVYETQGTGKNKTQRLVICYKFVGYLDIDPTQCHPNYTADIREGVAIEYVSCEPSDSLKELFSEGYSADDDSFAGAETEQT